MIFLIVYFVVLALLHSLEVRVLLSAQFFLSIMISIIVRIDSKGSIGDSGMLLHPDKYDLAHFRKITSSHIIIMGRKTWDSLPKKPLPNRFNIVATRGGNIEEADMTVTDLQHAIDYYKDKPYEVFIIGGGEIYRQALPYTKKIYLSVAEQVAPSADTFFPIEELRTDEWQQSGIAVYQGSVFHILERV